ncbi:MAG: response regulator, partial [Chlamydiales bacterium]|nr:response regulator [Chlamydiales bacterium]
SLTLTSDHIDIFLKGVDILEDLQKQDENTLADWVRSEYRKVRGLTKVCIDIAEGNELKLIRPEKKVEKVEEQSPKAQEKTETVTEEAPAPSKAAKEEVKPSEPRSQKEADQEAVAKAAAKKELEEEKDRVLRVSAENLNKMMGLAGESLVESRWLPAFSDSLLGLKRKFQKLVPIADKLRDIIDGMQHNQRILSEVVALQDVISECRNGLGERLSELELFSRRSSNLSDRLYREAIASRMRPFSDGTHGFPRMVRDIAKKLKKKVKFEIIGKETKVDRDILDKLEAPLNHILRNALDHGVETKEERDTTEKPAQARLKLEAKHQAGALMITVKDDGRGIDLERLRKKVVEKQLAPQEMVAQMDSKELIDFMFLPGFSTKEEVSEISGRGVGLDVVKSMLQEVSGSIHATSILGKGTEFCMQLPLTLSVASALSVEIAGEPYAFPLSRIDHALMVPKDRIKTIENHQFINIEGDNIGLVLAHQVLDQPSTRILEENSEIPVIVISNYFKQYGIAVDRFLGERDYVIQDLESKLGKIPNIYSGGLGDDRNPVLIIDVEDMVTNINRLLSEGQKLKRVKGTRKDIAGKQRILLVDDSITVREVEGQLLKDHGYEVDLACDGKDGWNAIRLGEYDLVITDIDMPRMDGFEFLNLIKSSSALRSIPVVIVSYKDRQEDRERGIELGASYYLTKESLHDNTLIEVVKKLLDRS